MLNLYKLTYDIALNTIDASYDHSPDIVLIKKPRQEQARRFIYDRMVHIRKMSDAFHSK